MQNVESPVVRSPTDKARILSFIRLPRGRRTRFIPAIAMVIAGVAAFAGTCTFQDTRFTNIANHDTYAGEVVNDTGVSFLATNVDVSFLDSNNDLVESERVTPALRSFQAGAVNFFSATASADASETSSATASLETDSTLETGTTVAGDFGLSNIVAERAADSTVLHVTGTITNNGSSLLDEPHVAVVVGDENGAVVVVATNVDISDLSSGESASFAVDVTVPDSTSIVSTIDVWADGLIDGVPVNPISSTGVSVVELAATATATATSTPIASATATPTS